ncbi:MAG: hypothetical protein ACREMA_11960, partial [Longimicrobiales bacterium]
YLDGWAHIHIPQLETFFTPWHAVLYSGFLAVAAFTVATSWRNRAIGQPWSRALPSGYEGTFLGIVIFAVGGIGDMLWHVLFGIETDFAALLSPTHLALAVGMGFIVAGPLRSTWRQGHAPGAPPGLTEQWPAWVSLGFLLAVFAFMTQYAHPFGFLWAAEAARPPVQAGERGIFLVQATGILGILLQTGIMMGLLLATLQRQALPPGILTPILTVNTVVLTLMRQRLLVSGPYLLIGIAVLGGIVGDLLLWWLRPSRERPQALRVFVFAMPAGLYAVYFLALMATTGIWWSVHLWTGAIVLSGLTGWLLSHLAIPSGPAGRG